jgi:hypothetical protein
MDEDYAIEGSTVGSKGMIIDEATTNSTVGSASIGVKSTERPVVDTDTEGILSENIPF